MNRHISILLLPLTLLFAGCEPDDDEVRGELPVTPAAATLTGDEKTVTLTADVTVDGADPEPIVYPLEWSVSDPGVGRVAAQSANSAVYVQSHPGTRATSNIIMVRDGLAREGLATVYWEPASTDAP
jgi:PBP1b-binding outer membrane lipoprotein LpoB